jgi:hypothetical protein
MGWSVPEVPERTPASACSPWICFFIIFFCVLISVAWLLFSGSAQELSSLSSGAWLPLAAAMLVSVMVILTLYLLGWEVQALKAFYWNSWRLNVHAAWQQNAHQHLCVVNQINLTVNTDCVPQLTGLVAKNDVIDKSTTLLASEALIPGISRFEQLSQALLKQIAPSLANWYPSGALTVVIQTSAASLEQEKQRVASLWKQHALPWTPTFYVLPAEFPFEFWNNQLLASHNPLLILAIHYRQVNETLAEFASALLLAPPLLLSAAQQREAVKVFRAMPLQTSELSAELKELKEMNQQPSASIGLVWFSGLTAPQRQQLTSAVFELPLSLRSSAPMAGLIDFDEGCDRYGHLAGWLMSVAAIEAVNYDMGSQWLVWADDKQAWAMVAGRKMPLMNTSPERAQAAPFPAGGMMLAVLLNTLLIWSLGFAFPAWLFSWWGTITLLAVLGVTLPSLAFALRKVVASALLPGFFRAAGEHERNKK